MAGDNNKCFIKETPLSCFKLSTNKIHGVRSEQQCSRTLEKFFSLGSIFGKTCKFIVKLDHLSALPNMVDRQVATIFSA